MDSTPALQDWALIQSFLAVAETGSLSAAARRLHSSQPTLGRQIQSLETALNANLFNRHARGLKLSETGASLLPHAQEMNAAMNALSVTAAGQSEALHGTVRITASVFASHYILPPILAEMRRQEPDIQLDLIPTDASENLLFREADIAVRMYRPTQLDVITRHITDVPMGVFAAGSYLDHAGTPATIEELLSHDLVGYDSNDLILRTMRNMGWNATRDQFAVRCDNQATYWQLVRAGCGIGFSQIGIGQADVSVREINLDLAIPALPVWLAAHHVIHQSPRIRRIWDLLAQGLRSQLRPERGSI